MRRQEARTGMVLLVMALAMGSASCAQPPAATATPTDGPGATRTAVPTEGPQPTQTLMPEPVRLKGPSCPQAFEEREVVRETVEIAAGATLSITAEAAPSVPCGWGALEISDESVIRQVDRLSEWPAEGVTPMPGAPGTEIWVLEASESGAARLTLPCYCLTEEGDEQETEGRFVVDVTVQ